MKIRYYGILASRNHPTKLQRCKEILDVDLSQEQDTARSHSWEDILFEFSGIDLRICPECKKGRMIRKEIIPRSIHAPP